jgi:Fe-S cluster assembly scaffold protein SufB
MLDALDKMMLEKIAGLHEMPIGAYNIRKNGEGVQRNSTANIEIISKVDQPGIDVIVKPYTKGESVHIPVILMRENIYDVVYNTFEIGEFADVQVVAGCGIHNPGEREARHDGIHTFHVRKGAHLKYVEKHYGEGEGSGERILNPTTVLEIEEGASVELELVQIKGVNHTKRVTTVTQDANSRLLITERLLTHQDFTAESEISVELNGTESTAQITSRSVAQDHSRQTFHFNLTGRSRCRGHVQCDAIIMHQAEVISIPQISAYSSEAQLIHEAAIGRIESEQLIKLMTLGLSEKAAEEAILVGFLK